VEFMGVDEAGHDQFKTVVNRRAGYGSTESKTDRVIGWLTRHPDATLHSGEGGLLLRRIQDLEAELAELRLRVAEDTTSSN
jgi:hypothetical protein